MNRIEIGQIGERLALEYLVNSGYIILARNYRTTLGEIDLIARKDETIIFVEVRTRRTTSFGTPEESITRAKQERLIRLAMQFCAHNYLYTKNLRFDVIAVYLYNDNPRIHHIPNAFLQEV